MNKKISYLIAIFLCFILFTVTFSGCIEKEISGLTHGILYINDSGEPKGGWEYTQPYYANLTINKGIGKLKIEVIPGGMGDKLTKHNFLMVLKNYTEDEMILLINGEEIILKWIEHDDVWEKWDNHYIASFGINMEEDETIGEIKPSVFPGVMDHYYLEIRLPKINQK